MHHIRTDARRQAWQDPKNPFSKWRPNRSASTASRLEDGTMSRTRTNPEQYTRGIEQDVDHNGKGRQQQHMSDPYANSQQRNFEAGDQVNNLEQLQSPDQFDNGLPSEKRDYDRGLQSDRTSSTEVPAANGGNSTGYYNEATSSGYQPDAGDEKKKRGLHLPGFLGGKKSKKNKKDADDNNGKEKQHFTLWGQFRATVLGSWINILLIFCPVGIALHFAKVNPVIIFVVNFIAIIPLAGLLSYATEEIALRTGEVMGGLLNATFGNAVELIVSIIALFQDQYLIVQTSLLGSMLSNLLLVMGMSFFFGGVNRLEQAFNTTVAQTASSLLFLAVASLIIPTAFEAWAQTGSDKTTSDATLVSGVPELSHATSVILLMVYGAYLFFQLRSHAAMYTAPSQKNQSRFTEDQKQSWKRKAGVTKLKAVTHRGSHERTPPSSSPVDQPPNLGQDDDDDKPETPQLSLAVAIFTLVAATVLVALNAEFLVDSINAVTCTSSGISKTFVGLILLPIVGNAAEHFTSVSVAIKDKMDLSIGVAIGSSLQIALLVLPLIVVIGWIAGKGNDMTLYFDGFQLAMLFVAIILVNYLIQDGKSHWLEGLLLMMLYIIIAVAAWFYPTSSAASGCT